jgi:hypothetical protein
VRLELTAESGEHLLVEVPQAHYRSRQITTGSQVYVSPRDVKVFAHDDADGLEALDEGHSLGAGI